MSKMNTHAFVALVFICLSVFCKLDAQGNFIGNERYSHYKQVFYIDNLEQKFIPDILNEVYYFQIDEAKYDVSYQEIDTIHQERRIFVFTKKAKDGYLLMNKSVMNRLEELKIGNAKILYIYNNKVVSTFNEVDRLLNLKAGNICISTILYDEESKIMSIYVSDR